MTEEKPLMQLFLMITSDLKKKINKKWNDANSNNQNAGKSTAVRYTYKLHVKIKA